jgi:membrane protease YdiL (CAAX protease family)
VGLAIVAFIFWAGIFIQLGALGRMPEIEVSDLEVPRLFVFHGLLVLVMAAWYLVGFAGTGRPRGEWAAQLGLRARRPWCELGIGLLVGVGAWLFVLAVLVGFGALLWQLGMEELLPAAPPAIVPWIAGLPLVVRLGISLSAGVVEETFFRGFLQPRLGILLSTLLFALAHLSYDQPIMLVGVTLLSLIYALLVRWRQSVLAAIAAHALFDGVQLVVVIPAALRFLGPPA